MGRWGAATREGRSGLALAGLPALLCPHVPAAAPKSPTRTRTLPSPLSEAASCPARVPASLPPLRVPAPAPPPVPAKPVRPRVWLRDLTSAPPPRPCLSSPGPAPLLSLALRPSTPVSPPRAPRPLRARRQTSGPEKPRAGVGGSLGAGPSWKETPGLALGAGRCLQAGRGVAGARRLAGDETTSALDWRCPGPRRGDVAVRTQHGRPSKQEWHGQGDSGRRGRQKQLRLHPLPTRPETREATCSADVFLPSCHLLPPQEQTPAAPWAFGRHTATPRSCLPCIQCGQVTEFWSL